jgi:hypothetical protein
VEHLPGPHFDTYLFPMIKRLAELEAFTARSSAPPLYAVGYSRFSDPVKAQARAYASLNATKVLLANVAPP